MKNLLFCYALILLLAGCGKGESPNPAPPPVLKPEIISFNPQSGIVGSNVNITGTNLSGVTSVKFNGVETPPTINGTSIDVKVPDKATTGTISVMSPGGTAISASSFTVLPTPVPPVIVKAFPASNAIN